MKEKMISYSDHKKAMERSRYKVTKRLAKIVKICQLETERKFTPKLPRLRWLHDWLLEIDKRLRKR